MGGDEREQGDVDRELIEPKEQLPRTANRLAIAGFAWFWYGLPLWRRAERG